MFLTVFLVLAFIQTTTALNYHLPKNTTIRDGLKVHFGTNWISTSGTPITITTYFTDNWLNYTCNAGTQNIHNGTKPQAVYFDDVNQTEDDTWSYTDGTVTVTPSGTDVGIVWASNGDGSPEEVGGTQFLFGINGSLGFQNDVNSIITLQITNGTLNSTTNAFNLGDSGYFSFSALNDTEITIVFVGINNVQVSGDQNNTNRVIQSGDTITVNSGNNVHIEWWILTEPWLPLMFIIGMIGLAASFAGPLYAINKIKHHEYHEGMRMGLILTVTGIAFVLAWLWV